MQWRSKKLWLPVAALLVLALAGGAWWWSGRQTSAPSYHPVQVERGDLGISVLSTGVVQPRNRLEIKPPIPGRVEQVLVEEGQYIKKNTVLAWMSSTERAALLDAARARGPEEVKRWEELYHATPILAPIDGTLILRNVEPGQSFTSNDAVFVMSDRLIVVAQVDETDIGQVKLRQGAQLELDAYPGQGFDGKVDQIAFDAKTVNNVTTYAVDVLPARVPPFMRSGMTANVSFRIEGRKNVLLLPADAVRNRDGRFYVLQSGADGKPAEKEITVGLSDGKRYEVLGGVGEGDTVLATRTQSAARNNKSGANPFMPGRRR
jgi:macrolide-specific efflux system membrane fusion protein